MSVGDNIQVNIKLRQWLHTDPKRRPAHLDGDRRPGQCSQRDPRDHLAAVVSGPPHRRPALKRSAAGLDVPARPPVGRARAAAALAVLAVVAVALVATDVFSGGSAS